MDIDASMSLNMDDVESLVRCPVCLNVPQMGPIYECHNGHIVCENCDVKLDKCPTCRVEFTRKRKRNLFAEQLLEKCTFLYPCPNASRGCTVKENKSMMREHESKCLARNVACLKRKCQKWVAFNFLLEHMKRHGTQEKPAVDDEDCMDRSWVMKRALTVQPPKVASWTLSYTKMHDLTFLPVFVHREDIFYACLYVLADAETAAKFRARISVNGPSLEITFTGPVFPVDKTLEQVLSTEQNNLLSFTKVQALQCIKNGDETGGEDSIDLTYRPILF
jgi:hypothetical protein